MIKFFRKIRQNLLSENKFIKYLMYAIGEIVLVVIGILIAVQINDWNEQRKESYQELEMLNGLSSDLAKNKVNISSMILNDSLIILANQHLITVLKDNNSLYNDSLQVYFAKIARYDAFFPQRMAYESLKSKGFQIIKNDALRTSIIELYDETYYINAHIRELQSDLYTGSIGMINKRLFTTSDIDHKIPINFNELKKDTEFINTISHITAEKINFQNYSSQMMIRTIMVKEEIDKEIEKLKK